MPTPNPWVYSGGTGVSELLKEANETLHRVQDTITQSHAALIQPVDSILDNAAEQVIQSQEWLKKAKRKQARVKRGRQLPGFGTVCPPGEEQVYDPTTNLPTGECKPEEPVEPTGSDGPTVPGGDGGGMPSECCVWLIPGLHGGADTWCAGACEGVDQTFPGATIVYGPSDAAGCRAYLDELLSRPGYTSQGFCVMAGTAPPEEPCVVCPPTCPAPPAPEPTTCERPQFVDNLPWIACLEDSEYPEMDGEPLQISEEKFEVSCVNKPKLCVP